jgi:hypothetical protein
VRRSGAAQLTLRTDRDWIADVVRFVVARKRGWAGARTDAPSVAGPAPAGAP